MKCLKTLDIYNSFCEKLVLVVISAIFFFFVIGHTVTGQGSYLTFIRKEGNQEDTKTFEKNQEQFFQFKRRLRVRICTLTGRETHLNSLRMISAIYIKQF